MTDPTRRKFLTAAGLTTAAGVAAVVVPDVTAHATDDAKLPAGSKGPMAAYIHDVRQGEVALMIEGRDVIVKDKRLVATLASAWARANRG
jgi:hypothetical protein